LAGFDAALLVSLQPRRRSHRRRNRRRLHRGPFPSPAASAYAARGVDQRDAHVAQSLRRARIQRVDVRRARDRRNRIRHVFGDHRRDRRAARAEAWGRERVLVRSAATLPDTRRSRGRYPSPRRRARGGDRLRAPGLHGSRPAQQGDQGRRARAVGRRGRHDDVRHRRAARARDVGREEDVREPRLVLGGQLSHDGRADVDVHAALRHRAHVRLGGARHRAARGRQDHPSVRELRRSGRSRVHACRSTHVTMSAPISNVRPAPDQVLVDIADYVARYAITSDEAYRTAHYCLLDTLGCGFEALSYPACTKLLGPIVAGTVVPNGAKVPGTAYQLDPVQAAFNLGAIIRWLDFNDTWLAAEWGHPSDNLGGILMTADWLSRTAVAAGHKPLAMHDVLTAMIKAHEIQGVIALANSFNRVGLDHVALVKVATTAVVANLLGLSRDEIVNAVSLTFVDGQSLRTYRHAPNTGSRKSWAAGDATSRGVRLALIAKTGEMGYPSVLTAKTWGFYDVLFKGQPFRFERGYGSYVMENVLFKISYPAEFHAQTAVECAMQLHPLVKDRIADIAKITIRTHESAIRIIDKKGPLDNPADRDHCIQYMVAVPLIFGRLTAADYEDGVAADPRIDALREKMVCVEDPGFTNDYLDPQKRSIANAIT